MAARVETLFETPTLRIRSYTCREAAHDPAREEASTAHEVVFVQTGVFLKSVAGRRIVADPNHVIFFNPDEPYRVGHPRDGGDECLIVTLSAEALGRLLETADPDARERGLRFARSHGLSTNRSALLQRRLRALLREAMPSALAIEETATDLLTDVAGGRGRDAHLGPGDHRGAVEAVMVTLAGYRDASPTLQDIADAVGYSTFHLCRVFQRGTGLPIHRYFDRLRLRSALERLMQGEKDLTRLALDLGFHDHSHFSLRFRREFGQPPSAVRRLFAARGAPALS